MTTALISGITGQDGSYLAELLLQKGYDVYGLVRRSSTHYTLNSNIIPIYGDLTDSPSLTNAIKESKPDEIYNLAAMSYVGSSWTHPVSTFDINACGVIRLLEAVRQNCPNARVYQASSSEMFGNQIGVLNEDSTYFPRSPYGISKVAAHHSIRNYRDSYNLWCVAGICFNHESPRRGIEFVTRKISDGVARIKTGLQDKVVLGNVGARRDWGYAGDYVEAMWLMLQDDEPRDYVIATGETHSVENFYYAACYIAGIDPVEHLRVDTSLYRPTDIYSLCGDHSRITKRLGWEPKTTFDQLVKMMVDADIKRIREDFLTFEPGDAFLYER